MAQDRKGESKIFKEDSDVNNWQATMWCEVVYAVLQADKAGREVGEFIPTELESKYRIARKGKPHRKAYNSAKEMFNDIANGRDDEP